MKRDMDLVRKILLVLEQHEHGYAPKQLEIEGCTDEQIHFHVWLMGDGGLLRVSDSSHGAGASPRAIPVSIVWEGYEFLEAAREDTMWEKAKSTISEAGVGLTIEMLKGVLGQLAKSAVGLT